MIAGTQEHIRERAALKRADIILMHSQSLLLELSDINASLGVFLTTGDSWDMRYRFRTVDKFVRQELALLAAETTKVPEERRWFYKTKSDMEQLLNVLWTLELKASNKPDQAFIDLTITAKQHIALLKVDLAGIQKAEQVALSTAINGKAGSNLLGFIVGLYFLSALLSWFLARRFSHEGTVSQLDYAASDSRIAKLRRETTHIDAAYELLRREVFGLDIKHPSGCHAVTSLPSAKQSQENLDVPLEASDYTEQTLYKAKEDAERANRAKSAFLSRMSHELRTPLNAILGFAQLLQRAKLPDPDQDSVEQILKAGRHLLGLINEVLDISRIESGRLSLKLERLSPLEIVQETTTLIEPQAARQTVQVYTEAGPAWRLHIVNDRQRFKQVLLNLISNAVKYNRDGGSVRISAEARAGWLRLNVADTGPGISKEKISRLFSPFERLGAETSGVEGTGIGLALSKRLVEAMSGRVGVSSQPGHGATFWVEYPLSATNATATEARSNTDLNQLRRSIDCPVVLCIEDNDSNFRLIERALAARPEIRLVAGKLGASAVDLALTHRPSLILLDLHLPDLGGDQVLRRLKVSAATSEIPVVIVSADATSEQIKSMLSEGAVEYLTKPLDIERLLTVVDEALQMGASNERYATKSD